MKSAPPFFIRGSARCAMRMKDQQETSMVVRNPSRFLGRGSDGMPQKIDFTPVPVIRSKTCSSCPGVLEIQRQEDRSADLAGQRFDIASGLVIDVGDRELRAQRAERFGTAPRDRSLAGNADDQTFLTIKQRCFSNRQ